MTDLFPFQLNDDLGILVSNYSIETSLRDDFIENEVYKFGLSVIGDLNISLDITSNGDDADLELYRDSNNNGEIDSSDERIAFSNNVGGDSISYQEASVDTYFARVKYYDGGNDNRLDYEISWDFESDSIPLSTNYDLGSLVIDGTTIEEISYLKDDTYEADLYKFEINEIANLNISLDITSTGDNDADLGFFRDSNNNGKMDFNDDEMIAVSDNEGNDSINYQGASADTYFAVVAYEEGDNDNRLDYELDLSAQSTQTARGSTVYRFFNPSASVHFYTADEVEKNYVSNNLDNYNFEGESYVSVDHLTGNSADAVYRFFNSSTGVHLYTTNEVERDYIIDNLSNFAFEGTNFYAHETEEAGTIPVYRFYEPTIGVHFYTPNEGEKIFVEENLSNYNYEGIAYYAYPN